MKSFVKQAPEVLGQDAMSVRIMSFGIMTFVMMTLSITPPGITIGVIKELSA
jgi:hypothetical protein